MKDSDAFADLFEKGLPAALTPAQRAKCVEFLYQSLRSHDSYQRLGAILEARLPMDVLFACLGYQWTMCDNIAAHGRSLQVLLQMATRKQRLLMMSEDERAEWEKLPDMLTVYRYCYENNRVGFSYTFSEEVAQDFTSFLRYQQPGNKQKYIITAKYPKQYAVLKLGRDEQEIIVTQLARVLTLECRAVSSDELELYESRLVEKRAKERTAKSKQPQTV